MFTDTILQNSDKISVMLTNEQLIVLANLLTKNAIAEYETKKQPPKWVTGRQASQILNIDYSTLYRWYKDGDVTVTKIGKKNFYDLNELQPKGGK